VLWAKRFKSVLLEGGEALAAVAAYIELSPFAPESQSFVESHFYNLKKLHYLAALVCSSRLIFMASELALFDRNGSPALDKNRRATCHALFCRKVS